MNKREYNIELHKLAEMLIDARAEKIRDKLIYSDSLSKIEEVQKAIGKLVKDGYND